MPPQAPGKGAQIYTQKAFTKDKQNKFFFIKWAFFIKHSENEKT